jgi:hypothetical protein
VKRASIIDHDPQVNWILIVTKKAVTQNLFTWMVIDFQVQYADIILGSFSLIHLLVIMLVIS